ncbi:MAG: 50S ribosomal protein L27 [Candidatus Collierbacteria bacterium GW2011_GWB1_45_35]|uniref:Large ribosomal subunit protein bL27 n=2 Tax=Candidatus Collieribacteriota TaxID=1752725 RepID=A0A0G1NQF6_9BACT|nr:MAG: 50S ribosomal protein L27 [Microgenomates group bacterium GW2011_GWC1_44_23]KKT86444.1 MAG: 50S ribosomal protein L27 [Candidatus Collierbacteria bacterium GW2011_GWA2_44_99]KKT95882.1 MAG: 50S ribosomal protein L27 [Candidatus Collierbacteria bacterium GW2011_GWA1_45_15]KKU01014.1 MAG: 50S ribosomal protein L27 [Candidatus Collierbacteria bacterium GW2011_GWB2_45_17]KKU05893.1 MAG: 50S ribosomal protein L27 [Candidatus Collierbacteria bacterium GW2011_GWB1_45_35]KKU07842.1 MAG: 50S ri
MAHVKSGGATRQHSQRAGKRLGVKLYGGQAIKTGQIIVRQRGAQFHAGVNTELGRDFTLFSLIEGVVKYRKLEGINYVDVISK